MKPSAPGFEPTSVTCTRESRNTVSEPRPPSRPSGAITSAPSRAESRARAVKTPAESLEHELAGGVVDRPQRELARQRGGEVGVADAWPRR